MFTAHFVITNEFINGRATFVSILLTIVKEAQKIKRKEEENLAARFGNEYAMSEQ